MAEPFPQVFLGVFLGILFRKAEGERKRHAKPEAGGHPEGLRQTVIAFNQPATQPMKHPSFAAHYLLLILIFLSVCLFWETLQPWHISIKG